MFYSSAAFKSICYRKGGYVTDDAIALDLVDVLGKKAPVIKRKINSGFTEAEKFVVASHFEMSPAEFCDVFLNGLFIWDREGHCIAHVDNPKLLLMPPTKKKSQRKTKKEDILERLKNLEEQEMRRLDDEL